MQLLLRFACVLLVGNVASLSTNFMQSEQTFHFLSTGQGAAMHQFGDPFKKGIQQEVTQWLSQLRGKNASAVLTEQQLAVRKLPWPHGSKESLTGHATRDDPAKTFMSSQVGKEIPMTRVIAVGFVLVISCLAMAALVLFVMEEEEHPDEQMPAKPREDLLAIEDCDGTWAVTYQKADKTSKQGLELLFRCHIIPTEEFAHSRVSQEHIDECVWIATHMLRQKALEDWTEQWPEALRTFEESVTACFAARTDVRSFDSNDGPMPHSPRAVQWLDSRGQLPTNFGRQAENSPMPGTRDVSGKLGPKDMGKASPQPSGAGLDKPPVSSKQSSVPPVLKTQSGRKSLMERCRQIMAASDARRSPPYGQINSQASATSESPQRVQGSTGATESPPRKGVKQID